MTTDVLDNRLRKEMNALRDADAVHQEVEAQPDFKSFDTASVAKYHIAPQDEAAWVAAWHFERDENGTYFGVPCRLPKGQLFSHGPNQEALMDLKYSDGHPCFTLEPPTHVQPEPTIQCFVRTSMGRCRKKVQRRAQLISHVKGFHTTEATLYSDVLDRIQKQVMEEDTSLKEFVESMRSADESFVAVAVGQPVEPIAEVIEDVIPEPTSDGPQLFFCEKPYCRRFFDSDPSRIAHQYKCKEVPVGTAT